LSASCLIQAGSFYNDSRGGALSVNGSKEQVPVPKTIRHKQSMFSEILGHYWAIPVVDVHDGLQETCRAINTAGGRKA
jgi:hypothetical protein